MERSDFFDRFHKLLCNVKKDHDLDTVHDALILWFSEHYFNIDPDEIKECIVADAKAEGVDAILRDQTNYELIFIQAKTVDDFKNIEKRLSEKDVKSTLQGVRFLLRGDYKGKITPQIENLVDEYHGEKGGRS